MQDVKLPEQLDRILNDKCISHSQVINAITTSFTKVKALMGESEQMLVLAKEIPKQLMVLLRDEHVDKSEGDVLDAIAYRFLGVTRLEGQTDAELRLAIKKVAP